MAKRGQPPEMLLQRVAARARDANHIADCHAAMVARVIDWLTLAISDDCPDTDAAKARAEVAEQMTPEAHAEGELRAHSIRSQLGIWKAECRLAGRDRRRRA